MNSTQAPFPAGRPVLKLPRRSTSGETSVPFAPAPAAAPDDELAALREREANLRSYEERLRAWQAEIDAARAPVGRVAVGTAFQRPNSSTPFGDEVALQAAWDKFHRARQLLEAEQEHLRNDRLAFREAEAALRRRESELMKREASLIAREQALLSEEERQKEKPLTTMQRLTQAPFLAALRVTK
ncbi:MAG: hypothetical protein NVV63_03350 [Opitutus sp.]|nr:hypothetical protein [Opitutus sp.]